MAYTTKYYLKEDEINIGDKIFINGVKTTFTKELFNDNPTLFKTVKSKNDESKPLFITDDGVEINNKKTLLYPVLKKDNAFPLKQPTSLSLIEQPLETDLYYWFSSEKAREKYIKENTYDVILGINENKFNFNDYVYYVDEWYCVDQYKVSTNHFNTLEKKFKNTKVFKNKKDTEKKAELDFKEYYDEIIGDFIENNVKIVDEEIINYNLIKYLAYKYNKSSVLVPNQFHIIMDDYSVDTIFQPSFTDIPFNSEKDAELAATILMKFNSKDTNKTTSQEVSDTPCKYGVDYDEESLCQKCGNYHF